MLSNPSPFATSYSKPDRDLAVPINEMCEHNFVGMTVSQAPESTVISISCQSGSLTTLIGLLRIGVRICNPLGDRHILQSELSSGCFGLTQRHFSISWILSVINSMENHRWVVEHHLSSGANPSQHSERG